ncbi:hypothetical protein REPUB_Repub01dG0238200 [Reevesia pubescens]
MKQLNVGTQGKQNHVVRLCEQSLGGQLDMSERICPQKTLLRVKCLYLQAVMLLGISYCNLFHIDLSVKASKRLLTAEVLLVIILSVLKVLSCGVGDGSILLQFNGQIIGFKAYCSICR